MRVRRMTLALISLVTLQVAGSLGFIAFTAGAQSEELVAVISLYTGRAVCEVQYRKSDNDQWGEESREGPPIACPGGIVVTEILTQEEADQIVADFEEDQASGRSSADDPKQIRTVAISGNAVTDDAAIQGEATELHETAAAESGSLPDGSTSFMAPGTLAALTPEENEPSAVILAANCKQGKVGQERRADFAWNQKRLVLRSRLTSTTSVSHVPTGKFERSSLGSLPTTIRCAFGSVTLSTPRFGAQLGLNTSKMSTGSVVQRYLRVGG